MLVVFFFTRTKERRWQGTVAVDVLAVLSCGAWRIGFRMELDQSYHIISGLKEK